ncbi:hypothetical protein [Roseovarius aestuariivivens]|uniref:hypothetical protein n=1 Tax=Roseovarius aestuariivivens TaxID=1888910 RepID=UPI001436CB76|nr:hypothetical protein [Roseovarius aestuariivivens]
MGLLKRPVQVVVTGLAGSGKSRLIEMMVARPEIGQAKSVPVFELTYGETEQALIERADGSVSSTAGLLKYCRIPEDAVRARQELPDPRLIQQEFVEIGLFGTDEEKRSALGAAVARADLVIWCSQEFGEEEQHLWSLVPDQMKDHSVLALTMAEQQLMRGILQSTIDRLEPIVADEFLGLFPVATIQGITARTSAEVRDEALWSSSGGKSLEELVSRQIRQGRTADIDQARIFMDRLLTKLPQPALAANAAGVASPVTPLTKCQAVDAAVSAASSDKHSLVVQSQAIDLLQRNAIRMLDALEGSEEPDTDMVLDGCKEAINSVTDLLGSADGGDPVTDSLQENLKEGEEMLMLFQLERGEDAALDAVTLVLQIRKELTEKMSN